MDNETLNKVIEFKNNLTDIDGKINNATSRVTDLKSNISALVDRYGSNKVTDRLNDVVSDIDSRIIKTSDTYKNIKLMIPQAEALIPMMRSNKQGLGLNLAPVIGITAAAGTVLAAVYGFTKLLDPVEAALTRQNLLLDSYATKQISETEYNKQALEITTNLNNQGYEIQKKTGVNFPVVVIGAGVVYAGYKILKKMRYI